MNVLHRCVCTGEEKRPKKTVKVCVDGLIDISYLHFVGFITTSKVMFHLRASIRLQELIMYLQIFEQNYAFRKKRKKINLITKI